MAATRTDEPNVSGISEVAMSEDMIVQRLVIESVATNGEGARQSR